MPRPVGFRLVRPIVVTAVLLAAALIVARPAPSRVQASVPEQPSRQGQVVGDGPNRAGVAVKFGDGRVESACVAFTEQSIGGDELLLRSGLVPAISDAGAVCSIGGEGCPTDDCFCQCSNFQDCQYWAYYQRQDNNWAYSQFGATADSVSVGNGGLQAWAWGAGNSTTGAPPPDIQYSDICPASSGDATATPTNTPEGGATSAPQVAFSVGAQTLSAQQCTTLNWTTVDAATVTLDGTPVSSTGSQQVCPTSTRTWTLVAGNAAGQTTRQVSVVVTGGAAGNPPPPTNTAPRQSGVTPRPTLLTVPTVHPIVTQPPAAPPVPPTTQAALVGGVPVAPTAELVPPTSPTRGATPTPYVFSLPPTETPRPRRVLGASGGPTPTPLLVARVASGAGGAPAAKAGSNSLAGSSRASQLVESRRFSPDLLPQYAAYIVSVAALLAMAWYTLRRRGGRATASVVQLAEDEEPAPGGPHEE